MSSVARRAFPGSARRSFRSRLRPGRYKTASPPRVTVPPIVVGPVLHASGDRFGRFLRRLLLATSGAGGRGAAGGVASESLAALPPRDLFSLVRAPLSAKSGFASAPAPPPSVFTSARSFGFPPLGFFALTSRTTSSVLTKSSASPPRWSSLSCVRARRFPGRDPDPSEPSEVEGPGSSVPPLSAKSAAGVFGLDPDAETPGVSGRLGAFAAGAPAAVFFSEEVVFREAAGFSPSRPCSFGSFFLSFFCRPEPPPG